MLQRRGATEVADTVGLFPRLGNFVVRRPLVVIGFWIALAAVLSLALPPLAVIAARNQAAVLPADAPALVTTQDMTEAFQEKATGSMLLAVLTDENGLGAADEKTYATLVDKLQQDSHSVMSLQDFLSAPPLREVLQSKDNQAWVMPITLIGDLGTPEAAAAYKDVAGLVKETVKGSTLTANLTGPAATVADLIEITERDLHLIEIGTAGMVLLILLIVYRNPLTMMLPLVTIGVSLATAQGLLAAFAELGLGVSAQTLIFMTGVMVGAGTDYAVFLISRYHDYVRLGEDSDQAVKLALASIGKVIAASAATVAVTFLAMIFTKLPVFSTVGPALAIAIAVAFMAAVTILPAILVLTGRRGWVKPRSDLTHRFWRRTGIRIVRRPKTHLVASLLVLGILASCATMAKYNYDDRKSLPGSVESARGYTALDRHLPINSILPQYLFVHSSQDLRTPGALADLEQMAQRVAQLPGVAMVRGITRPMGESLEQAKATYQAGVVGGKLDDASKQIHDHTDDLNKLTDGADQLAGALGDVRGQVGQTMGMVSGLVDALSFIQNQVGGEQALQDIDTASKLVTDMHGVGGRLTDVVDAARGAAPAVNALDASPVCDADPACVRSRDQLRRLSAANNDGTLDKLSDLAKQLQTTEGTESLQSTASGLRRALDTANSAMNSMGGPNGVQSRLTTLQDGSEQLADGSRQLADGVTELVDQTKVMGAGLGDASLFLLTMKHGASKSSMSGFYIPPQFLTNEDFKKAADIFISPDGHSTRYLIQTELNPFSTAAMDQVNSMTNAARSARPNTTLADAKISMAGVTAGLRDTRDLYNQDIKFIVIATVVIVLLILIALLRAIVAPLYLIASVLISYASALGIGVVVFQFILGQELHWSVPGMTFILLVAVGADYNLLLISRIRDESPHGVRFGVIRTVGSTGAVITSAGLIFAASMFGLTFASITTMVQIGFVIGVGILIDTFLVRTITVPAMAALVGQANWWPSRLKPRVPRVMKPKRASTLERLTNAKMWPSLLRRRDLPVAPAEHESAVVAPAELESIPVSFAKYESAGVAPAQPVSIAVAPKKLESIAVALTELESIAVASAQLESITAASAEQAPALVEQSAEQVPPPVEQPEQSTAPKDDESEAESVRVSPVRKHYRHWKGNMRRLVTERGSSTLPSDTDNDQVSVTPTAVDSPSGNDQVNDPDGVVFPHGASNGEHAGETNGEQPIEETQASADDPDLAYPQSGVGSDLEGCCPFWPNGDADCDARIWRGIRCRSVVGFPGSTGQSYGG